jgi:TolB-like protein/tetratricopeptide (TPR) repeat protein
LADAGSRGVFLSYASQDAQVAELIGESLRAAGIEVWFDRSELRGGDVWDQKIRQQIRDCALFVPLISANTAARGEGYFRVEWALAEQRAQRMARNRTFIVPVCVDSTPEGGADVPEAFTRVQWTRLPGGKVPPQFPARIAALLESHGTAAEAAAAAPASARASSAVAPSVFVAAPSVPTAPGPSAPVPPAAQGTRSTLRLLIGAVTLVIVVAIVMYYASQWYSPSRHDRHRADDQPANGTASIAEKSVAVLPFTDLSEKHDQEYFSDGLAEELIDALTKVPNLRVPARTSSFSFKGKAVTIKEIARALGVTHVLEGSVRKSGERLRITAQLVRADNGYHLWSETYDRDARDIFAVQDDITRAVSAELRSTLLGTPAAAPQQSTSPQAYTLYLQARHMVISDTGQDLVRAAGLYHRALDLDPNYAPAWVGLAFCLGRQVAQGVGADAAGPTPEWYAIHHAEIVAAANRAIALNANLPDAYDMLAVSHMQFDRNWLAAREALTKARVLDPNNVDMLATQGHLSAATGQPSEAIDAFRRAVQLDPLNLVTRKYLGRALHYARRPAESAEELRRAIAIDARFPGLHYELGRALLMMNDAVAASAAFEGEPAETSNWRLLGLPLGYRVSGDAARAKAALANLLAHSQGAEFQVAEAVAFFGDRDGAFDWLEKARTHHDPGVVWVRHDALLESIARDPRFAAYLKRLGMPPDRDD